MHEKFLLHQKTNFHKGRGVTLKKRAYTVKQKLKKTIIYVD
jgi:hypothetical protein